MVNISLDSGGSITTTEDGEFRIEDEDGNIILQYNNDNGKVTIPNADSIDADTLSIGGSSIYIDENEPSGAEVGDIWIRRST